MEQRHRLNLFSLDQIAGSFPSVPGGQHDTPLNRQTVAPIRMAGTVAAANLVTGLEYWGQPRFPSIDAISAFNGAFQFFQGLSDPDLPFLVNPTLVCDAGTMTGMHTDTAYTASLEIERGRVVGCAIGLDGGAHTVRIVGTRFQNVLNLNYVNVPVKSSTRTSSTRRCPAARLSSLCSGPTTSGRGGRPCRR